MQKNLVIVESPAKAKTISKFLGKKYKVKASVGHIRDLPKSSLGIDIDNNFEPKYITIRGKGPIVQELKKEAKKSDKVYLATDPDREGEAISWHLAHLLGIDDHEPVRIEFNEITKEAIQKAIKKPRTIDKNLVDAQQARRVLDRLVGYKISPLLWRKIKKGLSAGRVQSVAVKLICDREKEIEDFEAEEYWTIKALIEKDSNMFEAAFYGLVEEGNEKKIDLPSKDRVDEIINSIDKDNFIVKEVKKGSKKRNPYAPYTTSTLQQDASRKLGFSAKKTMSIAQQLYEGIDIKGEGTVGLVTYIRTDSTRISSEAIGMAKSYIIDNFGKEYSNGGKNYNNRKKEAQDAHECIRPTSILRKPSDIKDSLTKDQYLLYDLIWKRFLSSQMSPAMYDTISVKLLSNNNLFKANGSKLVFDGFIKVYGKNNQEDKEKETEIPMLLEGEVLSADEIKPEQHFTQPPARYTEASLIRTMEELGIGRPSTYSPTISTIINRRYVTLKNKSFHPTELGILVNDLLEEYFKDIVDIKFTAELEDKLDKIAEGDYSWQSVVDNFYDHFEKVLKKAEEEITNVKIEDEVTDEICEKCGRNMVIKYSRYGKFLACPGYPECKNTKPIMDKIGIKCTSCGGDIVRLRSGKGRIFYGCSNYPKCKFMTWDEPVAEKCPNCGSIMVKKKNKNGTVKKCSNKDCGYSLNEN
ncbi:MAG: type I DNA topoisomerase [Tissierellia bacterium]|nr:type I DNA topoisomerase [Tissierellia bacterium]